jgi:hypothetical protein
VAAAVVVRVELAQTALVQKVAMVAQHKHLLLLEHHKGIRVVVVVVRQQQVKVLVEPTLVTAE